MMCDEKASRSRRALAVLLTLVLLLGLIPGGALTVAAAGDSTVAVVVTDETGAPLPGAKVTYTVTSQTNGVVASASGQTDANGSIAVLRQESFAENDLTLTASATKDGYVYAAGSSALQSAAISAPQQEFPLQLRSTAITGVTGAAKAGLVYTGEPMTLVTVTRPMQCLRLLTRFLTLMKLRYAPAMKLTARPRKSPRGRMRAHTRSR